MSYRTKNKYDQKGIHKILLAYLKSHRKSAFGITHVYSFTEILLK